MSLEPIYSVINVFSMLIRKVLPNKVLQKYVEKPTSVYPKYVKLQIISRNLFNSFVGHTSYSKPDYTIKSIVIRNSPKELHKNEEILNCIKCLSMFKGYSSRTDNYEHYINTFRFAVDSAYHCVGPGIMTVINVEIPTETEVLLFGEE